LLRQVANRLLAALPIVIGASFITFLILYFVPGDPVITMLGDRANDRALVEKMRHQLQLDDPFFVRYGRFLWGAVQFDFGRSYRTNREIGAELLHALPASIELAFAAMLFAASLGVLSGIVSALKQYTFVDFGFTILALIGVSIPVFWLGLLLSYQFAFKHPWFEMTGRLGPDYLGYTSRTGFVLLDAILERDGELLVSGLRHLVLPATTLGLIGSALIARMTRSSVLEVKSQDYVRTAKAKGLGTLRLLWHILRNAMIPVVTIIGLQFGALLGGAIITEEIFGWPGIGTYLIQALRYRDIVAVQGAVMLVVLLFLLVNLVVDLIYVKIDPRVRA
jgi:ABC-type dipeptide/oligopeptide/nickel transport system permease component